MVLSPREFRELQIWYLTGKYSENELIQIAASLETWSEHPIAKAIIRSAKEKNVHLMPVSKLEAVPGFGVHGLLNDQECKIGNMDFVKGQELAGLLPEQMSRWRPLMWS